MRQSLLSLIFVFSAFTMNAGESNLPKPLPPQAENVLAQFERSTFQAEQAYLRAVRAAQKTAITSLRGISAQAARTGFQDQAAAVQQQIERVQNTEVKDHEGILVRQPIPLPNMIYSVWQFKDGGRVFQDPMRFEKTMVDVPWIGAVPYTAKDGIVHISNDRIELVCTYLPNGRFLVECVRHRDMNYVGELRYLILNKDLTEDYQNSQKKRQ